MGFGIVLVCSLLLLAEGKVVVINNTLPRLTDKGEILDGHDGRIQKFKPEGPYYLHALSYGKKIFSPTFIRSS